MSENHDKSSSHGKESVDHSSSSHGKESVDHSSSSHGKESVSPSSSSPSTKDKETFTITKVALWQIFVGVLVVVLAISVFTGGFGGISSITGGIVSDDANEPIRVVLNPEQPQPVPSAPTVPVVPPSVVEVDIGNSPVLGDEDAPVTIIEFSDFECPFCAKWNLETKGQIEEQYINTGKVKLVYMHYPLSFHPQAEPAALASECAYEQGKFWEFHDLIFENQRVISDANYKKWAADLGLDQAQFDDCYDSKKYQADVQDDFNKGQRAGVRGTPGFFVNGRLVSGAQPFSVFQQAIEAELNR